MKKILFAASECVPFVKTGGLADVVGALPKEFDPSIWDVRVVLPDYTCIPPQYRDKFEYVTHFNLTCGPFIGDKYVGVSSRVLARLAGSHAVLRSVLGGPSVVPSVVVVPVYVRTGSAGGAASALAVSATDTRAGGNAGS